MKSKSVYVFGIVVLIGVLSVIYTFIVRPQYYRFNGGEAYFKIADSYSFDDAYVQMAVIDDGIYLCSKNGLIKKNLNNQNVWSKSFYMETPYMVEAGNYLAVADIMKKKVYVFGHQGFLYEINEDWPVIDININEEGFLTTVMEGKNQHYIHYYNDRGQKTVGRGTRFVEDGYPIAVDTSRDLNRMVVSYLNIGNNRLQSKIAFFNFEEKYDQFNEKIVGGFTYENALPVDVFWVNDEIVVSVLDESLQVFNVKNEPKQIANIQFDTTILEVEATNNELVVWFGDAKQHSEKSYENSVAVFDFKGRLLKQHQFDEEIVGVTSNEDYYFVITKSKIIKYHRKNRIWFTSTYSEFTEFYEINRKTYVARGDYGYTILKMSER